MRRGLKAAGHNLARQAEAQEVGAARVDERSGWTESSVGASSNAGTIEMYSSYDQCSTRWLCGFSGRAACS